MTSKAAAMNPPMPSASSTGSPGLRVSAGNCAGVAVERGSPGGGAARGRPGVGGGGRREPDPQSDGVVLENGAVVQENAKAELVQPGRQVGRIPQRERGLPGSRRDGLSDGKTGGGRGRGVGGGEGGTQEPGA